MFDRGHRLTIIESVVELAHSITESADYTDLASIDVCVRAFRVNEIEARCYGLLRVPF